MRVIKPRIPYFGVYEDPELGVSWLVQRHGGQSTVGLPDSECPVRGPAMDCPHDITLGLEPNNTTLKSFKYLKSDLLFQVMLPIPKKESFKAVYVVTDGMKDWMALNLLQKMCSPVGTCYMSVDTAMMMKRRLFDLLNSSNIINLVITGITPLKLSALTELVHMSMGGKGTIIFAGEKIPPYNYKDILTFMEMEPEFTKAVMQMDFEDEINKLGSAILTRYTRGKNWSSL